MEPIPGLDDYLTDRDYSVHDDSAYLDYLADNANDQRILDEMDD